MNKYFRHLFVATLMIAAAVFYDYTTTECFLIPYQISQYSIIWWWMVAPTITLYMGALVVLICALIYVRRLHNTRLHTLEWTYSHDHPLYESDSGWTAKTVYWRDKFTE